MSFKRFTPVVCALACLCMSSNLDADLISGPNTDPMADGLVFGGNDLFAFDAGWSATGGSPINGNSAALMQYGPGNGGHGNSVPIDPSALPNGSLEIGDVLRYSMWSKDNPNAPVTGTPQIAPLLKFEFHNNQLDGAGTMKQFDTEQNAGLFTSVTPGSDWSLFSYEYVVDAANFQDLSAVQEIRAVLFAGEFAGGSGASGSYFIDNIAVEWFDDAALAAATPAGTVNPGPVKVPEPSSLVVLALVTMTCGRRRR